MSYHVEHTDTFAGEANYCWLRTYTIPGDPSRLSLIRKAKQLTGLTGIRCRVDNYGDGYTLHPSGLCQVVFINWKE